MNKVMLIGNVGADPEVSYYDQDQCVAQLRLATTERGYTLQNGTQVPDRTDWHNVLFYKRLAKVVEQYVHKGDKLYIEGRIRNRQWDDKKGVRHYSYEIMADNLELLTPKRRESAAPAPATTATKPATAATTPAQTSAEQSSEEEVLPF